MLLLIAWSVGYGLRHSINLSCLILHSDYCAISCESVERRRKGRRIIISYHFGRLAAQGQPSQGTMTGGIPGGRQEDTESQQSLLERKDLCSPMLHTAHLRRPQGPLGHVVLSPMLAKWSLRFRELVSHPRCCNRWRGQSWKPGSWWPPLDQFPPK